MKNYFSTHDIQNIQELINQALELKKKAIPAWNLEREKPLDCYF